MLLSTLLSTHKEKKCVYCPSLSFQDKFPLRMTQIVVAQCLFLTSNHFSCCFQLFVTSFALIAILSFAYLAVNFVIYAAEHYICQKLT